MPKYWDIRFSVLVNFDRIQKNKLLKQLTKENYVVNKENY